jgi:hypothetical protein
MTIGNGPGRRAMIEALQHAEQMAEDSAQLREIVRELRMPPVVPTSPLGAPPTDGPSGYRSVADIAADRQKRVDDAHPHPAPHARGCGRG